MSTLILSARAGTVAPPERRGHQATGRIARLSVGQCYGFIRLANAREVFFHRSDVSESTAFNDLCVGDAVTCELFDDTISGARALHVDRRPRVR